MPYLLCRLGRYYDAYLKYKILLPEFWNKELYILYFICLYNLFHIRHKIRIELLSKPDIDSDSIVRDIEQFDLDTILLKLPIDKALKNTLKDLVSYKLFSEKSKDADELSRQIHRQKKHADRGGASINSNIYSLLAKFQRTLKFCLSNCIEFDNPYFPNLVKDTVSGIINSHLTPDNKLAIGIDSTRIEALNSSHLFILLYFISTNELIELFKQFEVSEICFDKEAIEEFDKYVSNLYQSLFSNGRIKSLPFDIEVINNIIGNMAYLIGKSNNNFQSETTDKLYTIIHNLWSVMLDRSLEKSLFLTVRRCPPSDEMAINLLDDSISTNPYNSEHLARAVRSQLMNKHLVFDRIKDASVLHRNSDGRLGLALYDVLPQSLQEQFVEYAQQHTRQLIMFLLIIDHAKVKINNTSHFEVLLKSPNYTTGYEKEQLTGICLILAQMRKNELYSNVHSVIDDFGNKYEQYKFYLSPTDYKKVDQLDVKWVLRLDDSIIIELLCNSDMRKLLKEAVLAGSIEEIDINNRLIRLLL